MRIGPYAGRFSEAFRDPSFIGSFEEQFLAGSSMTSTDGKDVDLLELCHGEKTLKIAIKRFARRAWYRDRHAARHGSAAERSWRSAERLVAAGVGTARPGIGRLALATGRPVVAVGASGTERLWPRGRNLPHIRPWRRFPLALRCEVLGVLETDQPRFALQEIMAAIARCLAVSDRVTGRIT